jgi:hypothetical protein
MHGTVTGRVIDKCCPRPARHSERMAILTDDSDEEHPPLIAHGPEFLESTLSALSIPPGFSRYDEETGGN